MRKSRLVFSTLAAVVIVGGASLSADRVRLRSGQAVTGSFMSADVKTIRLLLANGSIAEFPVDSVTAVEFSPRKAPPAPAPDPSGMPPPKRFLCASRLSAPARLVCVVSRMGLTRKKSAKRNSGANARLHTKLPKCGV